MFDNYLSVPPIERPAIIIDGGGLVEKYYKQTEYYRRTGQALQLLNCRSACTMALSLPNACVYPHSVLKFHAAYNEETVIQKKLENILKIKKIQH